MDIFDLSGLVRIEGITDAQAGLAQMSTAAEGATTALTGTEQAASATGRATQAVASGFAQTAAAARQASSDTSAASGAYIELVTRLSAATNAFRAGTLTQDQYHAALKSIVADTTDLTNTLRLSEAEHQGFAQIVTQANAALRGEADAARQATATLDIVAAALAKLTTLHKTGAITTGQYREGLRTLNADLKQLAQTEEMTAAEQRRLNTLLGQTTVREAARGAQGLGTMRSALTSLSTQALGATGSLGSLAGGLLQFTTGGAVAAGVAVGLAALAGAWTILTSETRKAREENERITDQFAQQASAADGVSQAVRAIAAAEAQMTENAPDAEFWAKWARIARNMNGAPGGVMERFFRFLGSDEEAKIAKARSATNAGQIAETRELVAAYVKEADALAERIRLGQANNEQIERAGYLAGFLTQQATAQNLTLSQQNSLVTAANGLLDASTAVRGKWLAGLADAVSYFKELAALHPLTTEQQRELTGVLNLVTAAEGLSNLTRRESIALLRSEREALALLGGEEAKQAGKDLRAGVGASKFTAPQQPNDGRSLAPFALPDGIIDTRSLIPDAALQQMMADMDKAIAAAAGKATFTETREGFRQSIGRAITDGIVAGFDTAFATGDLGAGFGVLIGTLLSGLGSAMEQFGAAALVASQFMQDIMNSLSSLDPSGAVAASLGMIAAGAAIKALGQAASNAFGGGGGSGGRPGGVGRGGRSEAETTRIIVQPMGVREASAITPMRPVGPNIFVSPKDPTWQRQLTETIRHADSRKG